jgi:ribulose-5-phosphate 4-epimerase/fuculose-1-phosphate aldolase
MTGLSSAVAERRITGYADLNEGEQLACAVRILADLEYNENFTGHVTWQLPHTDELLVNPWGSWWNEVRASQVSIVDLSGRLVEGNPPSEAIFIHTELHRTRPDARVVIHNHPRYGTLLATLGLLPGIAHQAGCLFLDDMVLVDEYRGAVNDEASGQALAAEIGAATGVVLVSHGVLVTGADMAQAVYRAVTFERMCELAYHALQVGAQPRAIPREVAEPVKTWLLTKGAPAYWDGAVRMLLDRCPDVLT